MIWFTSDLHFSHKNIMEEEYENRPFYDIEDMNKWLITNWNSKILPTDNVYMLGDFMVSSKKHEVENILSK